MNDERRETLRTEDLLRTLERWRGARCPDCDASLCGHQVLLSAAAGFKDSPHCLACLGRALGRGPEELRDQLHRFIEGRDCWRAAWRHAAAAEGQDPAGLPACLWPGGRRELAVPAASRATAPEAAPREAVVSRLQWDAGDMGCGDLVLELRLRLAAMEPGQVLEVTARDPGAPEDLPAWCRLTGHALLGARHPRYWIRRKDG